ncbi:hypothetical protein GCM10010112_65900 [Actinoplanes lobatus]|uniref:Sugar-specific transcriptional regulator TrmB/DNA-binding CsgD family transcriptional regulator n=1 Tax=Actinoplanes lobatus TaxID=113568 RepID=A0A7W7HJZ7_9ACTN|nr:LuxR family transcriptional regulator [Actinoplanes lobatus]MBB4751934.1 sugar-specific transcriptional regulator TrmB/DNA-binding CsgD family transcriptional regulator [Actinoplanes lobatus]GGN85452.1 hypothetical protein GCM10010112_65900 [Actinoplanes lobatus]GIE44339.1 hypothetical protein Alo02nite_72370 [Actinoplanes lobatus]
MLAAFGLDAVAEKVYWQMLAEPHWGVAELVTHLAVPEAELRTALDALFEMTLVRDSIAHPGRLRAVSPEIGLTSALAQQQAELAERQQQVADSQAAIAQMISRLDHPGHSPTATTQILGMDAVQDLLARMARETQFEVLTFMTGGAQSPNALEHARRNDTELLERGVRIRAIGLDSIRNDRATLAHAQFLTDNGAEFRTSAVLPSRMILADRRIAVLPVDPANTRTGVLHLTNPGVITPLLALFQQVWDIATPFGATHEPDRQGLNPQERALLELLSEGHTDESAANQLGVSHRTVRRTMAGLMERLQARSRFEAGLRAVQHGWL